MPLPGTPFAVRTAAGPPGRPSLEVYASGVLIDVVVLTPLSAAVLRGACSVRRAGSRQAIAWGRLPEAPGEPVRVEFTAAGRHRRPRPAVVTVLGSWFWVALADGEVTGVTAAHSGGEERRRVRRVQRGRRVRP